MKSAPRTNTGVIALCLLLAGCGIVDQDPGKPVSDRHGWGYAAITVEGMPCLIFYRTSGSNVWSYEGVTCDWSKRK